MQALVKMLKGKDKDGKKKDFRITFKKIIKWG